MGRKPLPTAIHLRDNTFRHDRHSSDCPLPSPGIPTCPKVLSKTAKAEFRRLAKLLLDSNVITKIDGNVLALYCIAWERWNKSEGELLKQGEVIKSLTSGFPMQNPWLAVSNKAQLQMASYGGELGLSPSARTKIKVDRSAAEAAADPMSALLGKIDSMRKQRFFTPVSEKN
jgi:P27 family predicted phage terminase small subunit